ncbi:MAG: response regulator transcription factor [Anaerolineales bacterium]|nr:response regulator transcription factor [Anaerolineales bacterium]
MGETIRILIADDHAVVREGLRTLISRTPGMELVGEAANGLEAISQGEAFQPDVVLLDMVMPRLNGLEAIPKLKQVVPQVRILVLTSFDDDERVFAAVKAGALGYLLKDSSPQELLQAIRSVYQGQPSLAPNIAYKMIRELSQPSSLPQTEEPLTEREVETLRLIAQGLSNDEIAHKLTISERTVGKHVSNILEKLHLANRTQAALYALRQGLASLDD